MTDHRNELDEGGGTVAEPMSRVIADDLRQQIESGKLPGGTRLKTEVELREQYGQANALI